MKLLVLAFTCLVLSNSQLAAQQCTIQTTAKHFKIKLARTITSATARESDYVEFTTLEDIYSVPKDDCPVVLVAKETSVFGVVTRRKHRHFPFKKGELEIRLDPLKMWNGFEVPLEIVRHPPIPGKKAPKSCKGIISNCVAGRKNAVVAPVVPATAASGGAVVAAVAENAATKIIALSGLFTLLSAGEIGEFLNGTDAVVEEGEVFDMKIPANVEVVPPPKEKEKKE